jgi:hypothetical protein
VVNCQKKRISMASKNAKSRNSHSERASTALIVGNEWIQEKRYRSAGAA